MRKILGLVRFIRHCETAKLSWQSHWDCFVVSLLAMTFLCSSVFSATPSKIKYQGVLKEKGALVNGAKTMKFRITNSDGATAYWDSGNVSVITAQGAFTYELNPSTTIVWGSGGYYLEVTIGGQVLSPREEITSTVYALQAKDIDDGVVTSAKLADGAVTPQKVADNAVGNVKISSITWTKLTEVPAGFADGTDDTGGTLGADSIGNYHHSCPLKVEC